MRIGDTVITSKAWRSAHPRCKGRGVGEVVNVSPCQFGVAVSVKWQSGKYDQLSENELVILVPDDVTADATTR